MYNIQNSIFGFLKHKCGVGTDRTKDRKNLRETLDFFRKQRDRLGPHGKISIMSVISKLNELDTGDEEGMNVYLALHKYRKGQIVYDILTGEKMIVSNIMFFVEPSKPIYVCHVGPEDYVEYEEHDLSDTRPPDTY